MDRHGNVVDSGGQTCEGCTWRLVPVCENVGGICPGAERCGEDNEGVLHDSYLKRPGRAEELVGTLCLGANEDPLTEEDVWREVRTEWTVLVPEQNVSTQPPDATTIVNLPTYFHSGQPKQMSPETVPVFDFEVTVTARGEWEWTFEPGVTRTFHVPGSRYSDPNPEVQHTYRTVGDREVVLETRWWGSFYVGERGPYDIENPATQTSDPLPVDVVESASVLTD